MQLRAQLIAQPVLHILLRHLIHLQVHPTVPQVRAIRQQVPAIRQVPHHILQRVQVTRLVHQTTLL